MVDAMLPSVTAPYLAVHGSSPGDEYAAWLTSMIPSATFELWDGDAHYPHMVEPERFAARVREFALSSS
jgi:pimeloyl-ACP methyl ester carboxylesterase